MRPAPRPRAYTTAQRGIDQLTRLGVLTQTSAAKRDRLFCAEELLEILEEPTQIGLGQG